MAEKVLAMLKGGITSFEVVLTWQLEVLAIVIGGRKKRGGAQKVSDQRFSHFVASRHRN